MMGSTVSDDDEHLYTVMLHNAPELDVPDMTDFI